MNPAAPSTHDRTQALTTGSPGVPSLILALTTAMAGRALLGSTLSRLIRPQSR